MVIPSWVYGIVQQVAEMYGRKKLPKVLWRSCTGRRYSSGYFYKYQGRWILRKDPTIRITAGRDIEDQELVLLHELAHWLNPRHSHSVKFWNTAFDLYEKFGITNLEREFSYKLTAKFVYADRHNKLPRHDLNVQPSS